MILDHIEIWCYTTNFIRGRLRLKRFRSSHEIVTTIWILSLNALNAQNKLSWVEISQSGQWLIVSLKVVSFTRTFLDLSQWNFFMRTNVTKLLKISFLKSPKSGAKRPVGPDLVAFEPSVTNKTHSNNLNSLPELNPLIKPFTKVMPRPSWACFIALIIRK